MRVTFLRSRPADSLAEVTATSRRREGTTAIELGNPSESDVAAAAAGGVLVTSGTPTEVPVAGWVVDPAEAHRLTKKGVASWRITVRDEGPMEHVLDAVARSGAPYLRTKRSDIGRARRIADLPGLQVSISVFVDDVPQAVAAIAEGARDLVLRDWSVERIGELRDSLPDVQLVERSAFPPGVDIGDAREQLPADVFTTWLHLTDGSGVVRPRYEWAPGKDLDPPLPEQRISAEWTDAGWLTGRPPAGLDGAGDLRAILERALEGQAPSRDELVELFRARGDQVDAIAHVADQLRQQVAGDTVTYVVNRNINYTNLCYFKCGFCAFSKGPKSLNLRGEPYLMGLDEIVGDRKSVV